jgi:4-amino-4-deoxy-L-arabinose transferase-like glycosyltransferase
LAAFFFAFVPYNIYYSRVILPEPMGVLFALSAIWFFIKYNDSGKILNLIVSGVLFALSFLIKPFTAFYGLPLIYIFLEKYNFDFKRLFKNKKLIISLIVYLIIAFLPLLFWRKWMGKFPEGIPFYKWAFNGDGIRFRPAYWRWIFGERIGYLILGIWGLVPLIVGILQAKKGKFFNLFFFLGTILYTMVIATASVRHDYYQIFLIPAMSLLLAEGTLFLWQNTVYNRIICRVLAVFSIVMMLGMGTYQIKEYYKVNHPEIIEAGKALDKIAPKDALVLVPYNGDTAFLYQTGRRGWPGDDTTVNDIIEEGATFYVSVNFADKDTIDVMKRFTTVVRTESYVIVDLRKPNPSLNTQPAK